MEKLEQYSAKAIELLMTYAPKVLLALLTLIIGLSVIKGVSKLTNKIMERAKVDNTLRPFLVNMLRWGLKALLFISVASMVGIETTSFVAVLGAAGLAVGLALQGSLANFAGGALILIFRPYEVGHLIQAQGHLGVVKEIQIFTTILTSPDNKRVIVPNGSLSNGSIVNFTAEGRIRVDLVVGIAYEANIQVARDALMEMMKSQEKVMSDPAPIVTVLELGDSSVNLAVRPHCHPDHYWDVYFDTMEGAKRVLDDKGVSIPFPQRDVHLYQHTA